MEMPDRDWMNRFLDYVSQGLIALHLLLAVLYIDARSPLMVAANAACLVSGCIGLRVLRKERFRAHMLLLYCTELAHLILSAVGVGWSAGFQLPLIGLTALLFFSEYLGRSLELEFLPALPAGVVNLAVCALILPLRYHAPGPLSVSQRSASVIAVLWGILVFASVVAGMHSVLRMTSDSERVLTNRAQTDELTGLYNRAGYDRLCAEADLSTTTLVLVDTDKFKGINDRFGHETGDQVLKKIARSLSLNFRRRDSVCRIGGDEFAVLMADVGALEDELIQGKIARVNRELALTADDGLPYVSVSVGVACGSEAADWTELFKRADAALYQVKEDGGRGCRIYRP